MNITVGVQAGIHKRQCEDSAIVDKKVINHGIYRYHAGIPAVVGAADGVGGNAGGREASIFVAEHLANLLFPPNEKEIKEALFKLNNELIAYAADFPEKKQMAATLTAVIFVDGKCFLTHVGNTRMYVAQGSYLKQMTRDQTTYQWLLSCGRPEAAENCNKSEIFSCFGGGMHKLIKQMEVRRIFQEDLPDRMIITSDGVHEYVDIDRLEEMIFSDQCDEDIVKNVMQEAEKNGSEDDKTLIILRREHYE